MSDLVSMSWKERCQSELSFSVCFEILAEIPKNLRNLRILGLSRSLNVF